MYIHLLKQRALKNELEELGHRVRNIHNIRHRVTKNPTCLFYVDLEPQRNNADIYKITKLMHAQVKFEPPCKKKKLFNATDANNTTTIVDTANGVLDV